MTGTYVGMTDGVAAARPSRAGLVCCQRGGELAGLLSWADAGKRPAVSERLVCPGAHVRPLHVPSAFNTPGLTVSWFNTFTVPILNHDRINLR